MAAARAAPPRRPRLLLPLLVTLLLPAPSDGERGRPRAGRLRSESREGRAGSQRARGAGLRADPGRDGLSGEGEPSGTGRRPRGRAAGGGPGTLSTEPLEERPPSARRGSSTQSRTRAQTEERGVGQSRSWAGELGLGRG